MEFVEIPYPGVPETVGEPGMVYVFFFFFEPRTTQAVMHELEGLRHASEPSLLQWPATGRLRPTPLNRSLFHHLGGPDIDEFRKTRKTLQSLP